MCRSIKTLRPPMTLDVGADDIHAAALQYVRKISGFRAPAAHNRAAFDEAVDEIAAATARLLDALEVRGASSHGIAHTHAHAHAHAEDSAHDGAHGSAHTFDSADSSR
jgi:hypothetical protein